MLSSFTLLIKIFLYDLFKILPKKQFTHLKKARKLAKLRKIDAGSETLVKDTSFFFEMDESIERSWLPKNNIIYHKDYDWKEDNKFKDNMEIINNNKDVLDMNVFTKLLRATQDSNRFQSY